MSPELWKSELDSHSTGVLYNGLKAAYSSPTCTELVKMIQNDTLIQALTSMSGTLRFWENNYRHF